MSRYQELLKQLRSKTKAARERTALIEQTQAKWKDEFDEALTRFVSELKASNEIELDVDSSEDGHDLIDLLDAFLEEGRFGVDIEVSDIVHDNNPFEVYDELPILYRGLAFGFVIYVTWNDEDDQVWFYLSNVFQEKEEEIVGE